MQAAPLLVESEFARDRPVGLYLFFVLALLGTALLHGSLAVLGADFSLRPESYVTYVYLAGIAVPSVAAIALTEHGRRLAFISAALSLRGGWRAFSLAVFAQGLIVFGALLLFSGAGGAHRPTFELSAEFGLLAIGQIWVVFGEEFGWRGYALPRLVAGLGAQSATLVIAVIWGLWHTPMFFVVHSLQWQASPWLFAASIYAWSAIHTTLHLRSRPSIVPNLVFHAFANITLNFGFIFRELEPYLLASYVLLGTIFLVRMRTKLA
jgi:membrane protease YdiL (CAAX protease family)